MIKRLANLAQPSLAANAGQSLGLGYAILCAGEVLAKVLTLAAFARLAWVLGPGAFGRMEYCFSLVLTLTMLADFGTSTFGVREVAKNPSRVAAVARMLVPGRLWLAALSTGIVVVYAVVMPSVRPVATLLVLFGLSLLPGPYLLQWVFLGQRRMGYVCAAQAVRCGLFAAAVFLLVRGEADVWIAALAEAISVAASAGFCVLAYRMTTRHWPPTPMGWPHWGALRPVIPLGLSQFAWAAKYMLATVVVGALAGLGEGAAQVGCMGAATRIIIALHMFVSLYASNLLPAGAAAYAQSVGSLQSLVRQTLRTSTPAALGAAALLTLLAGPLVAVIYGQAYWQAAIVLQILSWMLAAGLVSSHFRVALLAAGRQGLELVAQAVGAAVALALMLLLYGPLGLVGIATAMVAGEVTTLVLAMLLARRCLRSIAALGCEVPSPQGGRFTRSTASRDERQSRQAVAPVDGGVRDPGVAS